MNINKKEVQNKDFDLPFLNVSYNYPAANFKYFSLGLPYSVSNPNERILELDDTDLAFMRIVTFLGIVMHKKDIKRLRRLILKFNEKCLKELGTMDQNIVEIYYTEYYNDMILIKELLKEKENKWSNK